VLSADPFAQVVPCMSQRHMKNNNFMLI